MKIEQVLEGLGEGVQCSLKNHTIRLDGLEVQQQIVVEPFDAVEVIEQLWKDYYNSVPDSKAFNTIPTKPREKFDYLDFVTAPNRSNVQWKLEVAIVLAYWAKCFPDFDGWYWRSPRFPQLVIFKQWVK